MCLSLELRLLVVVRANPSFDIVDHNMHIISRAELSWGDMMKFIIEVSATTGTDILSQITSSSLLHISTIARRLSKQKITNFLLQSSLFVFIFNYIFLFPRRAIRRLGSPVFLSLIALHSLENM